MDDFFDWVERLPIPYLLFYVLVYFAILTFMHILLWSDGTLPVGQWAAIIFVQYVWFIFIAAVWHFLRRSASSALDRFRPALGKLSDREFFQLKFRFTHLSARTGWLLVAIALAVFAILVGLAYVSFTDYLGPLFFSPYTTFLTLGFGLLIMPINLGSFYTLFRTISNINKIYSRVKRINLFNLTPLYALSSFTSRVGMIFIVLLLINLVTAPLYGGAEASSIGLFYIVFNGVLSVLAFVLPLLGIHNRLVAAKDASVEANNNLIESGFSRMQSLVKLGKHAEVAKLRSSNAALLDYRTELNKISTWPWDTSTLRTFITALAVPMIVWVVQQTLLRTVVK
jgi:hypothetical protein